MVVLVGTLSLLVGQLEAAPTRFASCPRSDRTVPHPLVPGARSELVPPGTSRLLLCRYRGLNPSVQRFQLLASDRVRKRSTVARIMAQLNALAPSTGVFSCPADFGALIVAYFRYRTGPDDVVNVDTSGCELITNGHVHRSASGGPGRQLLGELEAMTR